MPHRQSPEPALPQRIGFPAGILLLLAGGVLLADQQPAAATQVQVPRTPQPHNLSLGPPITLAEVASPANPVSDAAAPAPDNTSADASPAAQGSSEASPAPTAPTLPPEASDAPPLPPATVELPPLSEPAGANPVVSWDPTPANDTPSAEPATGSLQGNDSPKPPGASQPEPLPLELELTSNQQSYDAQLERYISTGNATANLAGGRLQADRIEVDPNTRTLFAFGKVRFQRGQQFFQASQLRYSLLEGIGELEDVYGVLDLDGSAQDLNLEMPPTAPLPPPEPFSCPPSLPPIPDWQPYPWAVTGWAGQMTTANFGQTFEFKGQFRPEYLMGVGLQRRIVDGGPLSFELDANLFGHHATRQGGGPYNQSVPFADTPAQTFAEGTFGIGMRLWLRPWLNVFFEEGVSLLSQPSNWEKTERERYATFLNYLAFEVEGLVTPEWSIVGRIHHRSGAYGVYSGVKEGSNAYLIGVRHRFGTAPKRRPPPQMPAPQGCAGAPPPESRPKEDLASQLEAVAMGGERRPDEPLPPPAPPPTAPPQSGSVWSRASQAEQARQAAIAKVDQRVAGVSFQQSLTAERRYGFPSQFTITNTESNYGPVRPSQLNPLTTKDNRRLLQGTISRWRLQASRITLTPSTFSGERVAFSNDPFTPAQSWMDSENVVGTLETNGDTVIKAGRNEVVLEDRLRIPARRQTVIKKKKEEVENPWVFGVDREDRDGVFLGYNVPIRLGERGLLTLQPQVLVERAIDGSTNSYPYPWQSAGSNPVKQPATAADDFGFLARLQTPFLGFDANARLDLSTFNPDNIPNGTRSHGELTRDLHLPWLGTTELRLFGAYRYRTWNGTLGEQDVYSAFGGFLEKQSILPQWGRLSTSYIWRAGIGNYQSDASNTNNLATLWRANAIGSLNASLPLWIGKPAPLTPLQGLANTAKPVVPGLTLNANLQGIAAYYGDGTNQNTLSLTGGPTLTLGHFVKPFLDFTQLTVTGGGTLRQGQSPFSFDRAVDLATMGIGLSQQIAGPLVFSGGLGLNVDPRSANYGEITGSYLELRWQRRAYEIGVYYSPYDGLGGVRVRLNDFNFTGPGVPFVPTSPAQQQLQRPF